MIDSKQQTLNLFEDARAIQLERCRKIARRIGKVKTFVTIDDVRNAPDFEKDEAIDGRFLGAVFNTNEWRGTGRYVKTTVKTSHDRVVQVWEFLGEPF